MTLKELGKQRVAHGGKFNWFLKCTTHGSVVTDSWCLSCQFAQDHNAKIWPEICKDFGWMTDEPAGDVPMG